MPNPGLNVLLIHAVVTAFLAGLIWTIQIVHYPLFDHVDETRFGDFHTSHSTRIGVVVGPTMAIELVSATWLLVQRPLGVATWLTVSAFVVLGVVHATTVAASIPSHNRLTDGFEFDAHRRLVRTNWVRTIGWSIRAVLAAVMVAEHVHALIG